MIPKTFKKLLLSMVFSCGLMFNLAACRQPNPTQLRTEPLTVQDTQIQAQTGQNFEIVLPSLGSRPSYKWVLQESYNKALLSFEGERAATSEFGDNPPQEYAPNRIFSFKPLAVGNTELHFTQEPINPGGTPVTAERRHQVQIQASLAPSPSPSVP